MNKYFSWEINMFKVTWSLGFLLFILFNVQILFAENETIEKTFPVKAGGNLTIDSDFGSIEVESSAQNQVEVKVVQEFRGWSRDEVNEFLKDFKVEFDHTGNDVQIVAKYRRSRKKDLWEDLKIKFIVNVPKKFNVDLNTAGGSISVANIEGNVKAHTAGGSLSFGHIIGPVEGHTSGGSINLQSCTGDAYIRTSGGSITMGEVDGEVDARTSGGSVTVRKGKGEVNVSTSGGSISVDEVMGAVDANTSGGSVTAYISEQPQKDCRLKTSGGTVTVYLDRDIGVYLDAKTSSGRVDCEFDILIKGQADKNWLRGEINGGGPDLYLRTSGGNIYIEKK
jgi:DUF4097 and DUF4098 domain-containing protein YvlB